ncbi:MAG: T9SS type A sorting domain-containing protein [Bacteroidetes bacterium]|nr:T9SS type A sorting domain-containing protein [Bacteroidota bacterium]
MEVKVGKLELPKILPGFRNPRQPITEFIIPSMPGSWTALNTNTSSTSYSWTIPNNPNTTSLVKIQDYYNSCIQDISNANFTIAPPQPYITVTYPNTNVTAYANNSITIQWTSGYLTSSFVKIEFTSDNGASWTDVVEPTENDGSYTWIFPNINSLNCRFRISEYNNPSVNDMSDVVFKVLPPFITVTSPNGGEQWKGCSTKAITWTAGGASGTYAIYYSTNNGQSWNYLSYTSSTSYSWSQVADVPTSNNCLIKVQDYNNASIKDSSDLTFTLIKNNDIIITSPNDGESWEVGTTKTVSWVSEPTSTKYYTYYSTNGGANWITIASYTYSTYVSWTIPNSPNTNSLVKVVDYDNSCIQDVSNATFTIAPPQPYIIVTYPNTNVTTYANNSITIQWTSGYLSSSFVKIEFTSDNGANWNTVITPTENDGSYTWTLPNINSLNCRFRISEYNNPSVNDMSDVVFKVLPPFITVTSPNGGEQWKGCSTKTITWTSGGASGTYSIYYSTNNGQSWNYLSYTSSTSYSWSQVADVPTSNNCLVKVQDYNNANIKDSSDLTFTLIKNNDIIITSPNGGESWEVGTTKTVSWVSEPTSTKYYTYYSTNGGANWSTIASYTYSTYVSWTIPNSPNTNSLVKVVDYDNSCIQDVSNANFTIAPPQPYIIVTYPNTNVTTFANNSITIQWTSGYLSSSFVKIEFTSDNGASWTTVVTPTENDGSYTWTLPNINSLFCKFRISEYNNPSVFDESDIVFKIVPPFIVVTSPNGGENWEGCTSKSISWTAGGTSSTYAIYYSTNNGQLWNYLTNTSSTSYTWSQVADVPTSNNCLIKVQDYNNATIKDSSDAVFTLKQNDDIIINSPNGGEQWQAGSYQNINWVSATSSTRYLVYYSTNYGVSWSSLNSYQYSQNYSWTIPNSPSTTCQVKVVDYDNSCIKDISNANFSIIPGTPMLTSPNGGESLYYGSTYSINWTSEYFYASYVSLTYSVDSGATWLPIVSVTSNSGSYSWNVPNNFSTKCLVKVNEYNNPSNYDISNAIFSIKPGLVITSPNGDNGMEEWRVCTQTTIKWNSGGGSGSYKIDYSIDNGLSWTTIISSYSSSGSNNTYDWTIPNTPSTQCLIRVTDNSYAIKTDISDATFTITPAIVINAPNGGESLQPGTIQNISWAATGSSSYYSIDYSINGGSTWTNIVYNQNIPGNSYAWLVPAASSSNCLVKVTDFINTCKLDKSNNAFAIGLPAPVINITSPNGGENLTGCATQNINWNSSGASGNFNIEYTADSGFTWNSIISNYNTLSGTYAWNVPNINSNKCKIRIKDANNWSTIDLSNNFFTITQSVTASINSSGLTTFCIGGNVILTSSSTTGNLWYPGGQTSQSITVSTSGLYYVTVSSLGCSAVSNNIGVTVNSLPAAPVASSNSPVAIYGTLQLSASTIPNASYQWSGPNGFTSAQQNPLFPNATSALNGIYSVRATVNTCQSPVATVNVTVTGVASNVVISGNVHTEQNYLMNNVKLKLNGSGANDSVITSTNGIYNFNVLQGNSYTITPSKGNDISALSGLSTLDLILIQRHILNIQPLNSAYKVIAADVNQSGNISTMDILLIKSLILQTATNFPNNEIWKFVNSDYVFSNPQQPFPYENTRSYSNANNLTDQNFIAVKLGDVNNSWNPNTSKNSAVGNINFDLLSQNANYGDIISIPVKVSNFNDVSGYQFSLEWNPNDFEFVAIDNEALIGNYGTNYASQGKITALWSTENTNGQNLADGTTVFTLKLKVINHNSVNSSIQINSSITHSEAYNSNLDELTVVATSANIRINNATSISENQKEGYYLLQNSPNPFSDNTLITFNLPENQKVVLTIYNLLGEEVYNFSGNYTKGKYCLTWNGKNQHNKELSNGNYLLKMQAGDFIANRKLILIR